MIEILKNVLSISLSTSVVILLVLLVKRLFPARYSAKWHYYLWLVIVLRLLIPINFSFQLDVPKVNIPVVDRSVVVDNTALTPAFYVRDTTPELVERASNPQNSKNIDLISLHNIIGFIYFSGIILFLLLNLRAYRDFKKTINKRGKTISEGSVFNILHRQLMEMRIKKEIRLMTIDNSSSPQLYGFLHPTILLPGREISEESLGYIFRHELTHYKRADIWIKLAAVIANSIHWFNPIVYLMMRSLNEDCEVSCDESVVQNMNMADRKRYGEIVIGLMRNTIGKHTAFSTHFFGGKNILKRRLSTMIETKAKKRGVISMCVIVVIALTAGIFVAWGQNKETKTLETQYFSVSVPTSYSEVRKDDRGSLELMINGGIVGGAQLMGYSADDNRPVYEQLIGNHAEIISKAELSGYPIPAYKVVVRRTPPAASEDHTAVIENHVYFVPKDFSINNVPVAIDLYELSGQAKEGTLEIMKKSFNFIDASTGNLTNIQRQEIVSFWNSAFPATKDTDLFPGYTSYLPPKELTPLVDKYGYQVFNIGLESTNPFAQWYSAYSLVEYFNDAGISSAVPKLKDLGKNSRYAAVRNAADFAADVLDKRFSHPKISKSKDRKIMFFTMFYECTNGGSNTVWQIKNGKLDPLYVFKDGKDGIQKGQFSIGINEVKTSPDGKYTAVVVMGRKCSWGFVIDNFNKSGALVKYNLFDLVLEKAGNKDVKLFKEPGKNGVYYGFIKNLNWKGNQELEYSYSYELDDNGNNSVESFSGTSICKCNNK